MQTSIVEQPAADPILRRPEVTARTGLPTSSLYGLMARDQFPKPIKLSAKAVGWRSSAVEAWVKSRETAAA